MARLFFAIEITCPWPEILPKGRLLKATARHQTLAFLGEHDPKSIIEEMDACNLSQLDIGPTGIFDRSLFLPERSPRVVSWHVEWLTQKEPLYELQKELMHHFVPHDTREFLPHVTIARQPFDKKSWENIFYPLPLYGSAICLYESVGDLSYLPLHVIPLVAPFEEKEHTADLAFCIRGKNMQELFFNAVVALSFSFPPFLGFLSRESLYTTLDEVIRGLNLIIAHADSAIGCPVKAVSFHGKAECREDNLLEWEMIVDV